MSDELYYVDALAWSEQQAERLQRVARGERVNDVDWPHVIEEITDLGLSELRACRSLIKQVLIHLLKIHGWCRCDARQHWRRETRRFLSDARDAFAPSMRQRIDMAEVFDEALTLVEPDEIDGAPPAPLPRECPFTLDDLLGAKFDLTALEAKLVSP